VLRGRVECKNLYKSYRIGEKEVKIDDLEDAADEKDPTSNAEFDTINNE